MSCGVRELSIDIRVDQERCRDLIPVEAVVWSVLVIALDLSGIRVESERRVCVQIVSGPIIADPRPWIPCPPIQRVRGGIIGPRDPGRTAAPLVETGLPGVAPPVSSRRDGT